MNEYKANNVLIASRKTIIEFAKSLEQLDEFSTDLVCGKLELDEDMANRLRYKASRLISLLDEAKPALNQVIRAIDKVCPPATNEGP